MDHRYYYPAAAEVLHRRCEEAAHAFYGGVLPTAVEERLTRELEVIERNGQATLYVIAAEIADESRKLGYPVTTRGMVGSSFVAWLCGFTAVNPLPAHYLCGCCRHFEPAEDLTDLHVHGFDLPDAICPECGCVMHPNGADIRPEILMGKDFEREPDIFLNVAPAVRKDIVDWMKTRFNDAVLLRAGISRNDRDGSIRENVHPGGIYFVPKELDVSTVTELRECAEDDDFGLPITVRDYSELYGVFYRIDVYSLSALGLLHDLELTTGVRQEDIPMNDSSVLEAFRRDGFDAFSPPRDDVALVREAIETAEPQSFSDIVQISGLLHGTGTWEPETKRLLDGRRPTELIAYRDDILRYLTDVGADFDTAFRIMERVRKGRGLTEEDEQLMKGLDVPAWIIDSCRRIGYVFPKSHGVEYAILSWKLAWYKQNHPETYEENAVRYLR